MVVPQGAQVLWRYDDPFYRSYAAITRNAYGQGAAYYLGTTPDQATLDQVLGQAMEEVGLQRLDLPEGVESVLRGEGDSQVRILLNHNEVPVHALGQELAPSGQGSSCDITDRKMRAYVVLVSLIRRRCKGKRLVIH